MLSCLSISLLLVTVNTQTVDYSKLIGGTKSLCEVQCGFCCLDDGVCGSYSECNFSKMLATIIVSVLFFLCVFIVIVSAFCQCFK